MTLPARVSATSRAASGLKRGSAAASAIASPPSRVSAPRANRQVPAAWDSSSGTLPIWPAPPAYPPARPAAVAAPVSCATLSRVRRSGVPIATASRSIAKRRSASCRLAPAVDSTSGELPIRPVSRVVAITAPPLTRPSATRTSALPCGHSCSREGASTKPDSASRSNASAVQAGPSTTLPLAMRTSSGSTRRSIRPPGSGPLSMAVVTTCAVPPAAAVIRTGLSASEAAPTRYEATRASPVSAPSAARRNATVAWGSPPPATAAVPSRMSAPLGSTTSPDPPDSAR